MKAWKKAVCVGMCVACVAVCASFLKPEQVQKVQVAQARHGTVTQKIRADAVLEHTRQSFALPMGAGVVEEVYVAQGQQVTKGQALYRISSAALQGQLSLLLAGRSAVEEMQAKEASQALAVLGTQETSLKEQIAACTVRAPFSGEVLAVQVEAGLPMQGGVLIGGEGKQARVYLPDSALAQVSDGMEVVLRREDRKWTRTLSQEDLAVSQTRSGYFEAAIPLGDTSGIPVGAMLTAELIESRDSGICVPLEALYAKEDAVLCLWQGRAVKAPVTILAQDSYDALVEGLAEGTQVILYPDEIEVGASVEVADEDTQD